MVNYQGVHNDQYKLIIEDVGEHYAKVFSVVKKVTGKTTIETKKVFDMRCKVVAIASKRELNQISIELQNVGAKLRYEIVDLSV